MKAFKVVSFCLVVGLMSCSSASSSKPNQSAPQSSGQTVVPELQRLGDTPSGKPAQEVLCVDPEHCWLQQGRNLWQSTDGGGHWTLVYTLSESELPRRFEFYSEQAGWAISGSDLYETADGGHTWVQKPSPFEKEGEIMAVQSLDRTDIVWLAGALYRPQTKDELKRGVPNNARAGNNVLEEAIFRSEDRGKSWQRQSLSPELIGRILDVRFVDTSNGIAIGENVFYFTSDGGRNWKRPQFQARCVSGEYLADTYEGQPTSVALLDTKLWWLSYNDGRVVKSEDGGRSWCDVLRPGTVRSDDGGRQYFRFLHFVSGQHGWALGQDKSLYQTKDGGVSWVLVTASLRFDSLTFPNRSYGLLVSKAGVFRVVSGA